MPYDKNSSRTTLPRTEHELGGTSQLEDELLEYRLKVLELEERVRYLEAIECSARRYVRRTNDPRRDADHKSFKDAKRDLVQALDLFEAVEADMWENVIETPQRKHGS